MEEMFRKWLGRGREPKLYDYVDWKILKDTNLHRDGETVLRCIRYARLNENEKTS